MLTANHQLDVLLQPLLNLPGVGPQRAQRLTELVGSRLIDLLFHLPIGITQRYALDSLAQAQPGTKITCTVMIDRHAVAKPYRIYAHDADARIELIYFNAHTQFLKKSVITGQSYGISGTIELYGGRLAMVHPDWIGPVDKKPHWEGAEPVYPLTAGLTNRLIRDLIVRVLPTLPQLAEWLPLTLVQQLRLPTWREAITQAHRPQSEADLQPENLARRRLLCDELLANQLALHTVRSFYKAAGGRSHPQATDLRQQFLQQLPFELTQGQQQALRDIDQDMQDDKRMIRLLQGDVGCGKTVVAFIAMLNVIAQGAQGALMVPTEVLARQHFQTLSAWGEKLGIIVALLVSAEPTAKKRQVTADIAAGKVHIVIGTHALIEGPIQFHDLGLVVIDEQHRFGVQQRIKLSEKGPRSDLLVMTATPIPRTLLLTNCGDLDISIIREKPANRAEIKTVALPLERLDEVIERVKTYARQGDKVYWICPLVEESEMLSNIQDCTQRHLSLLAVMPDQVGIVHGRMKSIDKQQALQDFMSGKTKVLVATTAIEVGIHVPDATIMIIEHAERFGLSQLHQLRGRIGRGEKASHCLLLHAHLNPYSWARIDTLRKTQDGFIIAEKDLQLRGPGEVFGQRQTGEHPFRFCPGEPPSEIVEILADQTSALIANASLRPALNDLMNLFNKTAAVAFLRSG